MELLIQLRIYKKNDQKRRKVSSKVYNVKNEDYIEYYNLYLPLIKCTLKKFSYKLDEFDLESCGMTGLLRCIKNWKKGKSKFSTYLVNCIGWECLTMIKERNKCKDITVKDLRSNFVPEFEFADLLYSLPARESEMIHDRFVSKMTLAEMAVKYQLCKETIRKRLIYIRKKIVEL